MQVIGRPLAAVLLALLPFVGPAAPAARAQQEVGLSVVGEGRVVAEPDLARVVIGVERQEQSLEAALAAAAGAMNAVVDRLMQLGVRREEIQTIRFAVEPVYDRGDRPVLRGYRVSNAVSATIRDLGRVGPVIDQAVAAGATTVEGVSFGTSRLAELKDRARELAVANARAKAEQLARLAGTSLGPVIRIEESDTGGPETVRADAAPAAAPAPPTPIEGGQLEIRTSVRVVWAIAG